MELCAEAAFQRTGLKVQFTASNKCSGELLSLLLRQVSAEAATESRKSKFDLCLHWHLNI